MRDLTANQLQSATNCQAVRHSGVRSCGLRFMLWRGLTTGDAFAPLSPQNMR